jgi:hypothetical protein
MSNSDSPSLIHLQWFGEEKPGQEAPAAPVAAAAAPAAPVADKGTPPASWRDTLPEPMKASPSLAKFESVDKLAKSYIEAESMIGRSIIPPGKDAKPEDWGKFYSKLGRPNSAEEYALTPEEGFEADPAFTSKLKAAFHSAGLTPAQANHVFGAISGEAVAADKISQEASAQAIAAGEAALRTKWGQNYDANVARAAQFAEKVGGPGAVKRLEELGVANDPLILDLLARAGEVPPGGFSSREPQRARKATLTPT